MGDKSEETKLLLSDSNHHSGSHHYNSISDYSVDKNHSPNDASNKYTGTLSFHDIQYTVQVSAGMCKQNEKVILDGISGVFKPGMNAIMGPTGGGKTSLLDILAGRKSKQGISGTVLINGGPQPEDFRLLSGYVVQDDVVMGTLSVRENLAFSAALRLPPSVTEKEREQRVEDVIQELGLQDCADSKVGCEFIRGISGGERKRTNVGMELIIKPIFLFMDEPTTGLDASTAGSIMSTMAQLSHRGHTIIFSIHQPRFAIFNLFDTLYVLTKGLTAYHGPATGAVKYLSSLGYVCQEHNNFADFLLDVVIENQASTSSDRSASSADEDKKIYETSQEDDTGVINVGYPTSFFTQLYYCSKRAFLNMKRNPKSSYGQILVTCFFAFIVGGIFFQLEESATSGIQDRMGAFFFILMLTQVMNGGAVELLMDERVVFIHEARSGFYRVSSYFLSKLLADLLPQRTIPTILFACISYYMMGLKPGVENFFIYMLDLLVCVYSSIGFNFIIGASCRKLANAEMFIAISLILQMLFSGFLINIQSLPPWLAWLEYCSLARYSYKVLSINELKDMVFCYPPPSNFTCIPGNYYLEIQGIDYSTWGLWQNFMAMGIIGLGLYIITYIKLRTVPKIPD
ncbi:broad substrate specificity ATP-binding cassette transporter ABCG2-like [Amphiura filiformis]|uniref:broad substrate specificity ATP-binding cassette transporter ABCG2-like n=1 Tax=Amphiura filiformis TaxID=82378 RepID=UPI003B21D0A6